MVKLFCAIVGADSVFSIEIDQNASVHDLKDAIKTTKKNDLQDIDAEQLQLFLAKTGDDKWLPDNNDLNKMLQNKVDFSNMKKMRATWKLNKELFGPNVSLGEDVIHALVVVTKQEVTVKKKQISPSFRQLADRLNLENPHLPRVGLVQKLYDSILVTNIVLLSSPAGSGKTSLLTLFALQFPEFVTYLLCFVILRKTPRHCLT
ncbi:hypothetical protein V7S43_010392 [Phytophthora oleae]|uniref:Crinkler effector protein N-terminal domain-containing protein n=1 Tax=Phytophthora oleae TaxID=2107226 RepID=A0ABD3FD00_9STRA